MHAKIALVSSHLKMDLPTLVKPLAYTPIPTLHIYIHILRKTPYNIQLLTIELNVQFISNNCRALVLLFYEILSHSWSLTDIETPFWTCFSSLERV
jgi:hypothetical protein